MLQYSCIFFQITVIGRYGSTNARAKIPLGFYYGHTYILPFENELKLMHDPLRGEGEAANQPEIDQHLAMMVALQEDIQCRLAGKKSIFASYFNVKHWDIIMLRIFFLPIIFFRPKNTLLLL